MIAASRNTSLSVCERRGGRDGSRCQLARWAALAAGCATLLGAAPAWTQQPAPEERALCVEEHETAQVHLQQKKLRAAREALRGCAHEGCPSAIRADCSEWLLAANRVAPSVVLSARTDAGDQADVRVSMDGELLASRLDGKAIDVDPGEHVFRFELPPYEPIERRVIILEGEKARVLSVHFGDAADARRSPPPPAPRPPAPAIEERRPVPASVYALGGVALVGAGVFTGFALTGASERSSLLSRCAPSCTDEEVRPVQLKFLIADIALGTGIAAAASATLLFALRPTVRAPAPSTPRSMSFSVAPQASGVLVGWGGAL
ncbi:uncharacterized protein SOCEGT47_068790 [Sorangium cellulosum]|uniref:PEGA domain-containing protein n=1 Tax=Sorangium cellulosum TaxID=56 RepID=A0A4P2QAL2_SORCE|nr:hypothetical protein [Sorangium cellulosum]AUX26318.1 uncharacterized protein SOCEGT47_068790 [Sorangium cellulosum]